MPVGLWVDDVILGCAADRGVEPPDRARASRSQSVPAHALDGRPAGLQARAGIAMALRHREEHQVEDDGDRRTGRRLRRTG